MFLKYFIISCMVVACFIIGSCRHKIEEMAPPANGNNGNGNGGSNNGGSSDPCDPTKIYFQQQVLPILVSNCAMSGCHDAASHQDGVVLTSYERVMSTADIRPGNPGNSDLYERITDDDPDDRMPRPPKSPLTQPQIKIIREWIEQGAENLVCEETCDTSNVTYALTIRPLISNNCQGCHSGTAAQAGIDLSTYSGVKAKISDGRLWGAINHQAGFSAMPKNGARLSDCEIAAIKIWMDAGSPNN